MNIAHAPGPWSVWYCSPKHVVVQSPDLRTVARLIHKTIEPGPFELAETAANAALISAAPELLFALEELKRESSPKAWTFADSAIAKAKTPVHKD